MKIPDSLQDKLKWKTVNTHSPEAEQFPWVESIIHAQEVCEDCFDTVVDRHIDYRKTKDGWTSKCRNCQLYKNPETGVFDMTNVDLRNYWLEKKKTK